MKNWRKMILLGGVLLFLAGCQHATLQPGRYLGKDRGEFAMVYRDLIFLRVKAARNIPGSLSFWEWGGKYSIDPDTRRITLDMERENARLWNFSYNILAERGMIVLQDLSENRRYRLVYETPALDNRPSNVPRPYSSSGVDPVYQPLTPVR